LLESGEVHGYEYAMVLQSMGEVACAQRQFDDALRYFEKALDEFHGIGNRRGETEILLLKGEVYNSRSERPLAIKVLKQARRIARSISAIDLVIRANRTLGSVMKYINSDHACRYLSMALTQAESCKMKLERMNIHRELVLYYKLASDPAKALYHFEQSMELQEEIFTENAGRQLRNFEILRNVDQYRKQIATLQEQGERMRRELDERERIFAELASRIVEKHELIERVERAFTQRIRLSAPGMADVLRDLRGTIRSLEDTRVNWEDLAKTFLMGNRRFLHRLTSRAPDLTEKELQVCVWLRCMESTVDIAEKMFVTEKMIYNHQDKIRAKLGIVVKRGESSAKQFENLKTFLLKLDVSEDESDNTWKPYFPSELS
jgi:tetratricopeptide (TPR) repeat protein/DNA-binding CsgD family transcriptional regulator